jgi:hypothetical protein
MLQQLDVSSVLILAKLQAFRAHSETSNRYFRDATIERFCKLVIQTGERRRRRIKEGSVLFHAQIGQYEGPKSSDDLNNKDQPFPFLPDRMSPPKDSAVEGRANPKGIPYLYLASDQSTAIAESRATKGDPISVGTFEMKKNVWVVDCSVGRSDSPTFYFEEPSPLKRTAAVWRDIDHAFSRPLNRSDNRADYVPTQILAELFKTQGFDGVVYGSSLADGHNIVLFDIQDAQLVTCCLFDVIRFDLQFEQASNPYVVSNGKITWNTIESISPL